MSVEPSDIGIATYNDVGDVQRLSTTAKNVVDALNEIYAAQQEGDETGRQLYVDGQNNIIFGKDNAVHGNNNLIIGSNNVIVGDNITLVASNTVRHKSLSIYYNYYDEVESKIYYYLPRGQENPTPSHVVVGNMIALQFSIDWTNEDSSDYVYETTPFYVAEILEIDNDSKYIRIDNTGISFDPPDEIHTVREYLTIDSFVFMVDGCKVIAGKRSVSLGGNATGEFSFSGPGGSASGFMSFNANLGNASDTYSAAFGNSFAKGAYSFSACSGEAAGDNSVAINQGHTFIPYSFASGMNSRVFARSIKCTDVDFTGKTLTIDNSCDITDIRASDIIMFRGYNINNPVLFFELHVTSVEGQVIHFSDNVMQGDGEYRIRLCSDGIIFVRDGSLVDALGGYAGGQNSAAADRNSHAFGMGVCAAAENSVIFGKFGVNQDPSSFALGNGTSSAATGLAFKVTQEGDVFADGEYSSPCADYSEFFEWEDGNPESEDRVGYFVKLNGEHIEKCSAFDKPLGVVSATPAIVGDASELHWRGKYVTDDFGRVQYHEVLVPEEKDQDDAVITPEHIEIQPMLNPEWDPSVKYIPRRDRPEWSTVGVLGKLIVRDDGTLSAGDMCRCGENGIATKAIENGYPVLKRIANDKVLIWFRG
ncbi:MAG: hypothetical protein K5768_08795 [Firmicutes bacterium]|nr:hypothetical protein [Bacillota bacterium]